VSTQKNPGITGVVVAAMLRSGTSRPPSRSSAGAGLPRRADADPRGAGRGAQSNYVTAIALMAFHEAQVREKTTRGIHRRDQGAQEYLKGLQWDEGEGKGQGRPVLRPRIRRQEPARLSNTSFFHGALHESGLPLTTRACRSAGVRLAVPEPQSEFNGQALGRQGQRRWVHLHGRQRRGQLAGGDPQSASAPTPA